MADKAFTSFFMALQLDANSCTVQIVATISAKAAIGPSCHPQGYIPNSKEKGNSAVKSLTMEPQTKLSPDDRPKNNSVCPLERWNWKTNDYWDPYSSIGTQTAVERERGQ